MMYELGNSKKSSHVVEEIKMHIEGSECIVITGAGISVASGIPLISNDVLGIPLKRVFQEPFWREKTELAFDIYREMLQTWRKAKPNEAHFAIARRKFSVITQNIDGLHRDAGSSKVLELHGNLRELVCHTCKAVFSSSLIFEQRIPQCPTCKSSLYPGFSLEGEPVRHIARAMEWVGSCEVLLIVGTQLAMSPVRQLREVVIARSKHVVWVNENAETWVSMLLDN